LKTAIKIENPHAISVCEWPWGFSVPSANPKVKTRYIVDVRERRCTCPAGYNRRTCKHVRWACEIWVQIWMVAVHRMTSGKAGWALLRQVEAYVEL
jgi:hypothetical protein